jgi:kynureninase
MGELVGGRPHEIVMMNTLTVNLHLMMATFYRPDSTRNKILIEEHAFPSDHHAVESQIRWHGLDPDRALLIVRPELGETAVRDDRICEMIERHHQSLALVMLPGVQYYTGQVLDMEAITRTAHRFGIPVGFDLAHAAGNIPMCLHDWGVDFAVWCTYKYLNSGPGSLAGCFIHERHATNTELPRLAGWWGHDKQTRFQMKSEFVPIPTAEGWQLSNPPILSLAAIRASLDMFARAGGIEKLRAKSIQMTDYFRQRLEQSLGTSVQILTPANRGGLPVVAPGSSSERPGQTGFRAIGREGDSYRLAGTQCHSGSSCATVQYVRRD